METGEKFVCSIEKSVYGGDGLARVDGCVVFVPGTIAGEKVLTEVVQKKRSYIRARLVEVQETSPYRQLPDADVPGCVYSHMTKETELKVKHEQLVYFLSKLKHPQIILHDSPSSLHYRNKITLHAQDGRLGYLTEPEHTVKDLPECPLAEPDINATLSAFRASPSFASLENGDEIVFRADATGRTVVLKLPKRKGYRRLAGRPLVWDGLAFRKTQIPELVEENGMIVDADGFFQVNRQMASLLCKRVTTWYEEDVANFPEILDLYCGVGVIGIACMKKGGLRLFGAEAVSRAVELAERNAQVAGVRAQFVRASLGSANRLGKKWLHDPTRTLAIVDPPRGGMSPNTIDAIIASGIRKLYYVSCDPATLTRDLMKFSAGKFEITNVELLNLFPRTARFETLVRLERY